MLLPLVRRTTPHAAKEREKQGMKAMFYVVMVDGLLFGIFLGIWMMNRLDDGCPHLSCNSAKAYLKTLHISIKKRTAGKS